MMHGATEPRFRVLIVSGQATEPPAVAKLLRQAGLQPEVLEHATSLADGVNLVADQTIGAVLLDLSTADGQGLSGLVRLQSLAPGIPILPYPDAGDTTALEQAHAVTCLQRAARKREQDRRLVHVATRDRLTGLANRWLLEDRLKCAVGRTCRSEQAGALYFIDLDDFKSVNDRFGHEAGDHLLQAFGQRMLHSLRETDTVARLGGDEFVVVMDKVVNRGNGERIRSRLQRLAALPYELPGQDIQVSASVGMALFPDDGTDLAALLRVADQGMYDDKRNRSDQAVR